MGTMSNNDQEHIATIRIEDLHLRTFIGILDGEKKEKQDVRIHVTIQYDVAKAINSDNIDYAIDYKTITKKIINKVESSRFALLEKLADTVLKIVMQNARIRQAHVRVDKPQALRFARTVSVELTDKR